jgi:DNA-binding MarR family transcriptional regulator
MQLAREFLEIVPQTMWSIRAEVRNAAKKKKARQALSVTQVRVLALLHAGRSRTVTNGELAERIGLSAPSMSRLVDGLVRRGFVTRRPQARDRRQVALALSSSGLRYFLAIRKTVEATFSRHFASLDPERAEALSRGLRILAELGRRE